MMNSDDPETLSRALAWAVNALEEAQALLEEVNSIGLWWKSDDDSDNRRRRSVLREADWAVSWAHREVKSCMAHQEQLRPVEAELASLVKFLEPLPDLVSVTRDPNPELSGAIAEALGRVSRMHSAVTLLRQQLAPTSE